MKLLKWFLLLALLAIAGAFGAVWSGVYNIGADDPHTPSVYKLLEYARERSIAARSDTIKVPDLTQPELLRSGAGNYDSMCTGCHLMPGMAETELSLGLYPKPPNLAARGNADPARDFWIVKHGIKASGMPAWGVSMDDEYIWGMVAFMQKLPGMSADEYRAMVAASPGHSHGGGETDVSGGHAEGDTAGGHDDNEMGGEHDEADPGERSSFEPVDDPLTQEPSAQDAEHDETEPHDH